MKACVTCSKPGNLTTCVACVERAESIMYALVPWTPFKEASIHPEVTKEGFGQCWKNSRYTVLRRDVPSQQGQLVHLSIKRNDKNPMHDWRDMQRIKNELLGPEEEAMELYPAESRLIDTANQYHLFCFLGMRAPFGYECERCVMEEVGDVCGGTGKQRPFEEKPADLITDEEWQEKFTKLSRERQLASASGDLLEALKLAEATLAANLSQSDALPQIRAAISKATEVRPC